MQDDPAKKPLMMGDIWAELSHDDKAFICDACGIELAVLPFHRVVSIYCKGEMTYEHRTTQGLRSLLRSNGMDHLTVDELFRAYEPSQDD